MRAALSLRPGVVGFGVGFGCGVGCGCGFGFGFGFEGVGLGFERAVVGCVVGLAGLAFAFGPLRGLAFTFAFAFDFELCASRALTFEVVPAAPRFTPRPDFFCPTSLPLLRRPRGEASPVSSAPVERGADFALVDPVFTLFEAIGVAREVGFVLVVISPSRTG